MQVSVKSYKKARKLLLKMYELLEQTGGTVLSLSLSLSSLDV
jgi:hypothetical protein